MRTLASIVTMALVAGPAAGAVVFSEDFNSGTLGSFTYADYMTDGSAFEWSTNGDAGLANFTDGDGSAATSNSDQEVGAYDHAIVSPLFQLNGGKTTLTMRTNYQNFANFDFADLDVTTDDGATWTTMLRYNEDHGAFYSRPGEEALVNLTRFAGEMIRLRFHHYNTDAEAFDWYWQVDDIKVESEVIPAPGAMALLGLAGLGAARRRARAH